MKLGKMMRRKTMTIVTSALGIGLASMLMRRKQ